VLLAKIEQGLAEIDDGTGIPHREARRRWIRYLQALWDGISAKPGEIPVPESHLILAQERLAEYRRGPSRARPARDVLDRLTNPDR
jgi:hypothetical protein